MAKYVVTLKSGRTETVTAEMMQTFGGGVSFLNMVMREVNTQRDGFGNNRHVEHHDIVAFFTDVEAAIKVE